MDIYVEPEQLIEKSSEIIVINNEIQRIMNDIELLVLSVGGDWQGDSERVFAEKILFVKSQFSHIARFFEDYSKLLNHSAVSYEQHESDIASKINLA